LGKKKKAKPGGRRPSKSKLKVGILTTPDQNLFFNNGLHQNAYNLLKLLKKSKIVEPFLLYPEAMFKGHAEKNNGVHEVWGEKTYPMLQKGLEMDVLLQVSYGLWLEHEYGPLVDAGTKMVKIHYGNTYIAQQEEFVFSPALKERPGGPMLSRIDNTNVVTHASWISPHFDWQDQFTAWTDNTIEKKASVCPYVWSPDILKINSGIGYEDSFHYRGDPRNKKVIVMEPNINIVKSSLIPLAACELAYREDPDSYESAYIFNADKYLDSNLTSYLGSYDCISSRKVSFEKRYRFPFIVKQGKLMLHHHLLNGLNYTLLEASHFRLPVVHNSEFMTDLGYYYEGVNVFDAAAALLDATRHDELSDAEMSDYHNRCDENLWKWSVDNPKNLKGYEDLIQEAASKK
jgi:hypothetical protein